MKRKQKLVVGCMYGRLPPRETETYREGVQFTTHDRGGLRLSTLGYGMPGWQGSKGKGYYMSNKHLTIKNTAIYVCIMPHIVRPHGNLPIPT